MRVASQEDGSVSVTLNREQVRILYEQLGELPAPATKRAHLIRRLYRELGFHLSLLKPPSYFTENG